MEGDSQVLKPKFSFTNLRNNTYLNSVSQSLRSSKSSPNLSSGYAISSGSSSIFDRPLPSSSSSLFFESPDLSQVKTQSHLELPIIQNDMVDYSKPKIKESKVLRKIKSFVSFFKP